MFVSDRLFAYLAVLCVLACGHGVSAPPAASEKCSTENLQLWLEDVFVDGVNVRLVHPSGVELVKFDASADPPEHLALVVGRDSVSFGSEYLADPTALTDEDVARVGERLAVDATPKQLALPVIADARVPSSSIARLLNAARGVGRSHVALIGERAFRARAPGVSSLSPKLEQVAGFAQALRTQRVREGRWHVDVYDRCPAGHSLFAAEGTALAEQLAGIPTALEDCACAADIAAVEAHVWGLSGRIGLKGRMVAHIVELADADDDGATVVRLTSSEPWSAGLARIARHSGKLSLAPVNSK